MMTSLDVTKEASIIPRKLDWMLADRWDDLRTIMTDNGTSIKFPQIGSQQSTVTIHGDRIVPVSRTIRMIMQLVSLRLKSSLC